MDVARKKKLQTGESEANIVIDTAVTGNELTVSIIEGHKSSFLYGYGEIASGLGFSPGDTGRVGTFDFDFMPKAAFERAKKSASRISNNTINNMMRGDKAKFAKRNVRNIIKEGIRTGKADSDIAKEIGEFFDDSKYWKAAEITRTEIPLAYNYGRIDAARTDGLKKARIELGGRPCSWCIDNHTLVRTLDQAETYMDAHHPNNDCTVVPLIDFEYYGIEPPEGYYPDEDGPIKPPERKLPGVPGIGNIASILPVKVEKGIVSAVPATQSQIDEAFDELMEIAEKEVEATRAQEEILLALTGEGEKLIIRDKAMKLWSTLSWEERAKDIRLIHLGSLKKGGGRRALASVLGESARLNKPIYFESTKEAVGFYRKYGFTEKTPQIFTATPEQALKIQERLLKEILGG